MHATTRVSALVLSVLSACASAQSIEVERLTPTPSRPGERVCPTISVKPDPSVLEGPPAKLERWSPDAKRTPSLAAETGLAEFRLRPPSDMSLQLNYCRPGTRLSWSGPRATYLSLEVKPKENLKQQRPWLLFGFDGAYSLATAQETYWTEEAYAPSFYFGTMAGVNFTHIVDANTHDNKKDLKIMYVAFDERRWIVISASCSDKDDYYLLQAAARSFRVAQAGETIEDLLTPAKLLPKLGEDSGAINVLACFGKTIERELLDIASTGKPAAAKAALAVLSKSGHRQTAEALAASPAAARADLKSDLQRTLKYIQNQFPKDKRPTK